METYKGWNRKQSSEYRWEYFGEDKEIEKLRDRTVVIDTEFLRELKDMDYHEFLDKHKAAYANIR
jgi:hypothetical protein